MALSDYINDTMALVHDTTFQFNSRTQVIRWINSTRREISKRTACVTRLISGNSPFGASAQPQAMIPGAIQPGQTPGAANNAYLYDQSQGYLRTIANCERYPFRGLINEFAKKQHEGITGVIDLITVSVNWGGTTRPTLDWLPFADFQAWVRAYSVVNSSYPSVWTTLTDGTSGELYLYPIPSQALEMELYAACMPADIYTDDDYDVIPSHMADAVKYGTARLIYQQSKRYMDAQLMEGEYESRIMVDVGAADRGKTPSFYY